MKSSLHYVQKLDMELAAIEKGGYEHFMLKEIFEQPQTYMIVCVEGWMQQKEPSPWRRSEIILNSL